MSNTKLQNSARRRRREEISLGNSRYGLDFVDLKKADDNYKLFLHFISSAPEAVGREAVPKSGISDMLIFPGTEKTPVTEFVKIADMTKGKWERRIDRVIDKAVNFDGKLKIDIGDSIELADRSFTIEFWAKRNFSEKNQVIIGQGSAEPNKCLRIGFKDEKKFGFGFFGNDLDAVITQEDKNWHHWACVYDSAPKRQTVYRDGEKIAEGLATTNYKGYGNFCIGAGVSEDAPDDIRYWNQAQSKIINSSFLGQMFEGELADIRVWSKDRSDSQVKAHMHTGLRGNEENLLAYWPASVNKSILKDNTVNGHDGTLSVASSAKELEKPITPPGYEARYKAGEKENGVELYKKGDVLTLTIPKDQPAIKKDISLYTIELANIVGLDRFFSKALFHTDDEISIDPAQVSVLKKKEQKSPEVDYLTKDYKSFRQVISDRISAIAPEWKERRTPGVGMAIIEILAYAGDYLSYFQDAVAMEAYYRTARSRVSLSRHLRLIDYFMHEGCNARVWVHMKTAKVTFDLAPRTPLLTKSKGAPLLLSPDHMQDAINSGALVFETMHHAKLYKKHNQISFYTWGGNEPMISKGAVSATLKGEYPDIGVGDILIFKEAKDPDTGRTEDANPSLRHAVRIRETKISEDPPGSAGSAKITEIRWLQADALPFDLYLTKISNGKEINDISVALGNIVLADHGMTAPEQTLSVKEKKDLRRIYTKVANPTYATEYDQVKAKKVAAGEIIRQNPETALPSIILTEKYTKEKWLPRTDLFNSDRFARHMVVEIENDRSAYIRFGDGKYGKAPATGTEFTLLSRVGNGVSGNIGRETLSHIKTGESGIVEITNPISAFGGTAPENAEHARLLGPSAFESQMRCVTIEDYAKKAMTHPEVQKANVRVKWTGSENAIYIELERIDGKIVDSEFRTRIRNFMEEFRVMGTRIKVGGA
jgi:hypothetical protein